MIRTIITTVVIACLCLVGCSRDQEEGLDEMVQPSQTVQDKDTFEMVEGEIGNGALYALYCPNDWNGDLVVYAHGYVWPWEEVLLPEWIINDLRDEWVARGYGVAYSSYTENGFAVKEGASNTRQLRGLFVSHFGMPDETYITGTSMGGIITMLLTERNSRLYAGALPMCGAVGGSQTAIDYVYTVRTLFDYYYPGVLPGDAQYVPPDLDINEAVFVLALNALLANPLPAFEIAAIDQVDIRYNDAEELINSILWDLFFQIGTYHDMMDRTHGHNFFDNMDVVYTGSTDDASLNANVDRFESTRDAQNYLKRWYEPRGKLDIPVITLHTTRDPVVPVWEEDVFAQIVDQAGYSEMLRQYEVDRFGHCEFTVEEVMAAFEELTAWAAELRQDYELSD